MGRKRPACWKAEPRTPGVHLACARWEELRPHGGPLPGAGLPPRSRPLGVHRRRGLPFELWPRCWPRTEHLHDSAVGVLELALYGCHKPSYQLAAEASGGGSCLEEPPSLLTPTGPG